MLEEGFISKGLKVGNWMGYSNSGIAIYKEKYENGKLIQGISYDSIGNSYFYTNITELPTIYGGDSALKQYLTAELNYPEAAQKNSFYGRAIVQLTIGKNGELLKADSFSKIGFGCDQEALRVIKNWKQFIPGKTRGQLDNMNMFIFIEFPPENNLK
ncbi:MAG: TonB family protein [Bacteroidetes bacterium]|nr:TonB family protein [Bacteroidota bacterium]